MKGNYGKILESKALFLYAADKACDAPNGILLQHMRTSAAHRRYPWPGLYRQLLQSWLDFNRAGKKLEFQLALGQVALKFCLPWASLRYLADDLPGPLPIGQVRMKNDLPNRKIYLSRTTGRHFFLALLQVQRHVSNFSGMPATKLLN